jgi:thiamine biosynthesis lipoprotein
MRRNILYASVLLAILVALIYVMVVYDGDNSPRYQKPVEDEDFIMNTTITQRVYGKNAKKAAKEAFMRLKDIEEKMTINAPGGEIDKLNNLAGKEYASLSQETLYVLKKAKEYSKLSGGAFDVTIGPIVKAWGINTPKQRIPSNAEIEKLLDIVDYEDLIIDEDERKAKLQRPDQIVDLGAIAKGYGGDQVVEIYKKYDVKSAYINLGGNVIVLGKKPDGNLWRIGIQNPRQAKGINVGVLTLADKAVVTSGDYERYFEKDGKRYHHILDPKTGFPSDSGLISVTIVADLSIDADALSTSVFVLGLEKGMKLIENIPEVEGIFITKDKEVYLTPGLKDIFSMSDESKDYIYVEKR